MKMKADLSTFFEHTLPEIDSALDRLLPSEGAPPPEIHRAMRYSIFAGGKRLRPALCLAGYSIYSQDYSRILPIAAAIEMVHTYSLIHDDLPAMDDDDFRRGIPSCHKRFGEAMAILAGDALLTLAFEVVASCRHFAAEQLVETAAVLARALGTREGMIAGQVLDLEGEGRSINAGELEAIHRAKTGALLSRSVWLGAFLGGGRPDELEQILTYGRKIGLAFQIVDDILDETQSKETLGKTAGKDRERGKATYPALFGLDRSRELVRQMTGEARAAVRSLGSSAQLLLDIADFLETRCS
jgi:geranylgeranyl diphosphate synthase type II